MFGEVLGNAGGIASRVDPMTPAQERPSSLVWQETQVCCLLSGQIQNTTSSPHDLGAPAWPAALQPYGHGDMNFSLSTVNFLLHQKWEGGPLVIIVWHYHLLLVV